MFGLFRKKAAPSPVLAGADRVYTNIEAMTAAVVRDVRSLAGSKSAVVLAPFRGDLAPWRDRFARHEITVAELGHSVRDAAPAPGALPAVDYATLGRLLDAGLAGSSAEFFLLGRHPLRSRDAAVEAALEAHSRAHRLRVYLSLDEGLLKAFDRDGSIKKLCESLGVDPMEPIESPMVSRSIENAQERIAKKATGDAPAETFEAWISQNAAGR